MLIELDALPDLRDRFFTEFDLHVQKDQEIIYLHLNEPPSHVDRANESSGYA